MIATAARACIRGKCRRRAVNDVELLAFHRNGRQIGKGHSPVGIRYATGWPICDDTIAHIDKTTTGEFAFVLWQNPTVRRIERNENNVAEARCAPVIEIHRRE